MFKRKRRLKREARRRKLREHSREQPTTFFEPLEDRVLFSTLMGPGTFDFTDANDQTVRVVTEGNASDRIELIGTSVGRGTIQNVGSLAAELDGLVKRVGE